MVTLEHRKYGVKGCEFIMHHSTLHPTRLLVCFVVTTTASSFFKLHEVNINILWVLSALLAIVLFFRLFNKVTKEVLLVLPSLGVQVKTQYWFGQQETHFFDKACVHGIVIAEAITMQSVLCYLAVLLAPSKTEKVEHIVPLFTHSWPRQKDLVYMYREVESMRSETHKTSSADTPHAQDDSIEQKSQGDTTGLTSASGDTTASEPITHRLKPRTVQTLSTVNKRRTRSLQATS